MNLYQTVQYILSVAKVQPNVSYAAEGDIYQIMNYKDGSPKYSAVVVSQSTHAESGEWRGYNFEIFYIDRLTADQSNRLQVQNIAIEVLSNIAKVLVETGFEIQGELRYHTFDEKFEDLCAGAYMEIVLQSEESLCADGELPYIPGGGGIEPSWFDPADYYTSAQTDERIEIEIEKAQFSGKTLEDYWTSAQTQNAINDAVSGISVSGVTEEELQTAIAAETARTEATYLKEHQSLDNYYTKSETDDKIAEAFSAATASGVTRQELNDAIATETARTEQTYVKQQSLNNYYTKTEVDSAITEAIGEIDLSDYYTSGQTDSAISTAVQDKVSSTTIAQIWTGSQAQYDAMTGHSANILYIINS